MSLEEREREYQAALAAYRVAMQRLMSAKAARPDCWEAYLAGERDLKTLAERYDKPVIRIRKEIEKNLRDKAFGPETEPEYRARMLDADRHRQFIDEERRVRANREWQDWSNPDHSDAWREAFRRYKGW